ncbi:unnamed protein product [Amoebophrya sp. A120]|nr:unnamed protein product [Amoebophrya sp. A120]|eukprot:GSA120T00007097001.1
MACSSTTKPTISQPTYKVLDTFENGSGQLLLEEVLQRLEKTRGLFQEEADALEQFDEDVIFGSNSSAAISSALEKHDAKIKLLEKEKKKMKKRSKKEKNKMNQEKDKNANSKSNLDKFIIPTSAQERDEFRRSALSILNRLNPMLEGLREDFAISRMVEVSHASGRKPSVDDGRVVDVEDEDEEQIEGGPAEDVEEPVFIGPDLVEHNFGYASNHERKLMLAALSLAGGDTLKPKHIKWLMNYRHANSRREDEADAKSSKIVFKLDKDVVHPVLEQAGLSADVDYDQLVKCINDPKAVIEEDFGMDVDTVLRAFNEG